VQDLQALLRFLAQPESNLRAAEFLRSRFVRVSDAGLAALAPALSAAVIAPDPPSVELSDEDLRLLACARSGALRWMALTDRVPPGELIDLVMRESMYAMELTGLRAGQARENVKKVRGLVRRVENRGYTTIGRLAEYFETLRAGDESNAVIEARGCVSLMTIHAAKGLEFPAVFVVNLHAPGRGGSQGVTVIERSVDGQPEVAFGATDGTKLEDRRELEELRRLLYVAVTRARDRLYLAGEVDDDGILRAPKRSLANLLPISLRQMFTRASLTEDDEVQWEGGGHPFAVRVCRASPPATAPHRRVEAGEEEGERAVSADRGPLVPDPPVVRSATSFGPSTRPSADLAPEKDDVRRDRALGRLAGTLVHRLFQLGVAGQHQAADLAKHLGRLARPEELVDVPDVRQFFAEVARAFAALAGRPDVSAWLAAGRAHYEVPFSFASPDTPGVVLRGSIDCLIVHPDGSIRVLEFKTGAPQPEHRAQIETYLAAARSFFPAADVTGELVYPAPGD
jgi:ATP-dependent helicase/nuclease subunit A